MKYFVYVLLVLSVVLIGYNLTHVDYDAPFSDDSIVAVITVVSGLCAILLLLIILQSKKLEKQLKR